MPKRRGTRGRRSQARRAILTARQLRTVQRCLREPPRKSGIAGARWSVPRIQRLLRKRFSLRLKPRYALRRLREAGLRVTLKRAREPGLSQAALARLARTLRRAPRAAGLPGERWSRARIAELIERRHKRRFTPAHASRLARQVKRKGLGTTRDRRLTSVQARELRDVLRPKGRRLSAMPSFTRSQVAALIQERFGVQYHAQSIPALLRRWRIRFRLAATPVGGPRPDAAQLTDLARVLASPPAEVGISAPRWEQRHIARFMAERFQLQCPTRGLYRRLARWGVAAPQRAAAGATCALTGEQRCVLADALAVAPAQSGLTAPRWSRALVAAFVEQHFHVHYEPASIPQLLRREGLRLRPTPVCDAPAHREPEPPDAPPLSPPPPTFMQPVPASLPAGRLPTG